MYTYIKRVIDTFISIVATIVTFPVVILLCILVWVASPKWSPIFTQERAGKNAKPFRMYKVRTMTNDVDENGILLDDSRRLKWWGILLRKTCLDELPNFWNVLIGNMAIVGPRALPMSYISKYTKEQRKRLNVLPGITCIQQVEGTNSTEWGERFDRDIYYVEHYNIIMDTTLVIRTVGKIVRRPFMKNDEIAYSAFAGDELKR